MISCGSDHALAEEDYPGGGIFAETQGDGDRGVAGGGGDRPGGAAGRADEGVEVVLGEHCVDAFLAGGFLDVREGVGVGFVGKIALRLGLQEKLLTEFGQLGVLVLVVELDQFHERFVLRSAGGEVLFRSALNS